MPRRIGLHDSTYFHVFNRGADRQDIFTDAADHAFFERLLAELVRDLGIRVHAYALMTNHFHVLIEAVGDVLSEAMYRLGRAYVVVYNRSVERTGPLFDSRFQAVPIESSEALMIEGRYIHRNPLDIVGMSALHAYRFSSLGIYAGHRECPDWLTTDTLLTPFSSEGAYLDFVRRTHPTDTQYAGQRPPLQSVSGDDLEAVLADVADLQPELLRSSVRGRRNDARLLAVLLSSQLRIEPADCAAVRFGFESTQAFRVSNARAKALLQRDPEFARFRERVLVALAA